MTAAKAAGALQFIEQLPDGFDTLVGKKGVKLSGGQAQRIALARAYLIGAPMLILDEATAAAALDASMEQHVLAIAMSPIQQQTRLMISH